MSGESCENINRCPASEIAEYLICDKTTKLDVNRRRVTPRPTSYTATVVKAKPREIDRYRGAKEDAAFSGDSSYGSPPLLSATTSSSSSLYSAGEQGQRGSGALSLAPGHDNPFQRIPTDLLLTLLQHLPPSSLQRLAQTSSALHTVITTNMESLYRHRVLTLFRLQSQRRQHSYRMMFEGIQEQTWCDMYWRLSVCRTRWVGCALDRATNHFEPYPMELVIKNAATTRGSSSVRIDGVCRWRSVGDAVTKMKGCVKVEEGWSTSVEFREHKLVRGPADTVALPNKYTAECFGSVMLGMYDPGSTRAVRGCFALVMEESFWGTDETEPIVFVPGRPYFGVITTVDAAEKGLYSSCRLMFEKAKDGEDCSAGAFIIPGTEHSARITIANKSSSSSRFHFDASSDDESHPSNAWWNPPADPCVPDGKVDVKKIGNVVVGLFNEPTVGCFYIGL
ncbi:hypothetical protein PhCBS80983_g04063 [Powellomyces hirtus]|uniref:F-box domain-containing protein n=1 Tax=Powellomyces hirtus TaxID=109895 RepID=A0A507DZ47_9FUNG|nr:hypothetical protein PhCBS80983_g04063 [Powellomyces hirtus]